MAARKTPGSPKPDKLMRDALMLELHETVDLPISRNSKKTHPVKKLRLVARTLVNEAIKGDIVAVKEINDRVDGKVTQIIAGEGKHGAIPIDIKNLTTGQIEALKERIIADLVAKGRIRAPVATSS